MRCRLRATQKLLHPKYLYYAVAIVNLWSGLGLKYAPNDSGNVPPEDLEPKEF